MVNEKSTKNTDYTQRKRHLTLTFCHFLLFVYYFLCRRKYIFMGAVNLGELFVNSGGDVEKKTLTITMNSFTLPWTRRKKWDSSVSSSDYGWGSHQNFSLTCFRYEGKGMSVIWLFFYTSINIHINWQLSTRLFQWYIVLDSLKTTKFCSSPLWYTYYRGKINLPPCNRQHTRVFRLPILDGA